MLTEIEQLLSLQEFDERLEDLAAQLDRLAAQRSALEAKQQGEERTVTDTREHLRHLEHESRMRTLAVDELDSQIREYQKRLDEGIISFKEMEDLRAKINSERSRINRLEDEALDLMNQVDSQHNVIADAEDHLGVRTTEIGSQIEQLDRRVHGINEELHECKHDRDRLVGEMAPYLCSQYESLRGTFARPVASIENGTCSGCKLRLSGHTVERVRSESCIVTCEHCSRILYID